MEVEFSVNPHVSKKYGLTAGAMYSLFSYLWPSYASKNGFFKVSIRYIHETFPGSTVEDIRKAFSEMERERDIETLGYREDIPYDKDFYIMPNYYGEAEK